MKTRGQRILNSSKPLLGILLCALVIFLGDTRLGQLPPIIKFIDPFHGFWQNAESRDQKMELSSELNGIDQHVRIVLDQRGVPHIFAENEQDLYFVQGYLTARDRLWQMEFQTHAAAGRLCEIVGDKALEFDREQRTIGMSWAAERAMQSIPLDSASALALSAYTAGVNHYIENLHPDQLPIEYKLLDYRPEPWSMFKSSLLLKYMAKMLTGTERDRSNTEALKLLGPVLFNKLFPEQNYLNDPIVPDFRTDSVRSFAAYGNVHLSANWKTEEYQPAFVGSNNWAVSGKRTESGNAILCNDPHLALSLPSIWYEIQLNAPGINCYGVSLPGSPGITIGFNDSIAWGVTNAGRDVQDYYALDMVDRKKGTYRIGDRELQVEQRLEEIKVRGKASVMDTVLYTVFGPIIGKNEATNEYLALRWLAHDPSNELLTFHKLNHAKNHADYTDALSTYSCPGQNFAYADCRDNIAIWQQGRFKEVAKDHGRFILKGNDPNELNEKFIPANHNPNMKNPERGFVSSANQAPTDTTYPYYYSGVFEEFRNRTINNFLRADSSVTIEDMMDLQLSNYNLLAAEALPLMLALLDTSTFKNKENEQLALNELRQWDHRNDKGIIAPTIFEIWWDELNNILWDEFNSPEWNQEMYYRYSWLELEKSGRPSVDMRDKRYVYPMSKVTIGLLQNEPEHAIFDHHSTNNKVETAKDVIYDSFYWTAMKFGDVIKYEFSAPHWGHYQGTKVKHLARLDAFSSPKLFVGGSEHAPNATTSTHGPSWRMVVELDPERPKAWGVLPGGQSGNPGSARYQTSLPSWANGEYHELLFLRADDQVDPSLHTLTFKPSSK